MPFIPKSIKKFGKEVFETVFVDPFNKVSQEIGRTAENIIEEGERAIRNVGGLFQPAQDADAPTGEQLPVIAAEPELAAPEQTALTSLKPPVPPEQEEISLGTSMERLRRRRARGRRGGSIFGGAGLLVPRAGIQRQTLGGF